MDRRWIQMAMAGRAAGAQDCDTDAQPRTRVLVAGLDRLLSDLVDRLVNAEPDMEVVGTLGSDEDLVAAAERKGASVAVVSLADPDLLAMAHGVLDERPTLRLVALQDGGRDTVVLEFRPYLVRCGELSADGLVRAIRAAAQRSAQRSEA